MSTPKLSDAELAARLPTGWTVQAGKLHREYQFADFVRAFGFMTSCALVAERLNHHPEWFNAYRKVVVDLTTHDAGGISAKDLELAAAMDELARART
jgi:4a-hydroxytetrahydrobiopterin dehydratase